MHPKAKEFLEFIAKHFSEYFQNKKVLDVGAGDINGNNRYLFKDCQYEGNDVVRAKNVTVVSKTKDLDFPEHTFDTVVSSECFEHDPEYKESILKIYNMLNSFYKSLPENMQIYFTGELSDNQEYQGLVDLNVNQFIQYKPL